MKTLLEELKELRDNGPRYRACGICNNCSEEHADTLKSLFKQWPKYSGDEKFPIPGGALAYGAPVSLWDRNTEYSSLRWELLDWLIEQLSKEEEKKEMDIRVGDVWKTREGDYCTITGVDFSARYPVLSDQMFSYDSQGFYWSSHDRHKRDLVELISRAPEKEQEDTYKKLEDMTDAEVGALFRAYKAGKTIEFYNIDCWCSATYPTWSGDFIYRVKPEPVVTKETVTLSTEKTLAKVTLTLIDGVVQPTAEVEKL